MLTWRLYKGKEKVCILIWVITCIGRMPLSLWPLSSKVFEGLVFWVNKNHNPIKFKAKLSQTIWKKLRNSSRHVHGLDCPGIQRKYRDFGNQEVWLQKPWLYSTIPGKTVLTQLCLYSDHFGVAYQLLSVALHLLDYLELLNRNSWVTMRFCFGMC